MLLNSLLFIFLIIFSIILFFINNFYIILSFLIVSVLLSIIFKVKLPLYLPFIILLIINFLFNYLLSSLEDAILVTMRLLIMFIVVNLIIKKIGIVNIGKIIGNMFHSRELSLIISISLSFIPIMIKELSSIKNSLITKNFPFTLKNVLTKPQVYVVTFFSLLFKRVSELEKVLISKGVE